ncbi:MAG: hypothetical protein RMK91_00205 [Pseudanabaenaceae cyanobacterium SKYGB_i_bin29]|nr:hypothetical protein [Pseudanabaenaceae cyanobacterium SKYG29]MDW8420276.1 hypothetical protein [Pseudanabaenaceae cyanobacterium SKYGB_i_bin29]
MNRWLATALFLSLSPSVWGAELLPQVRATILAIEQSANERNLDRLLSYIAPEFQTSDGMNAEQLRAHLQTLWGRYGQMQYRTTVEGWEEREGNYLIKTTTTIRGWQPRDRDDFTLEAKISSEQTYRWQNNRWQMVRQNILAERSVLKAGDDPPAVELRLPTEIGVGRNYTVDAIVTRPLGNSFVLGAILEEPVNSGNYLKERSVDLAPLRAGGIFKIGSAPFQEGQRWISAVLVQEGGITIVTQRLKVSRNFTGNQYTPLPDLPTNRRLQPKEPRNL